MESNDPSISADVLVRFWAKVTKSDGCWMWRGHPKTYIRRSSGEIVHYRPMLWVDGQAWKASRISWRIHFGAIPEGMLVCHTCDVAGCVRPDHLFLGTNHDNMRDMAAKGRGKYHCGEQNGNAVLTADKVREIWKLREAGWAIYELASEFGVGRRTIDHIVNGRTWRHLMPIQEAVS